MVEARKSDERDQVADNAAGDLSRLAEASSKLFAEQAAAMAVMTAYGMSVAAQMTGMMLGALRTSADVAGSAGDSAQERDVSDKPEARSAEPASAATVVELRPRAKRAAVSTKVAPKVPVKAEAQPVKPTRGKAKTGRAPASEGDDLKKISGIGPRLEQVLHERGIRRYADIAAMTKAAIKKLDTELGLEGRIVRDDWVGQSKALSGGKG
jgi:NADH-quinone oxidoreductase subunit E